MAFRDWFNFSFLQRRSVTYVQYMLEPKPDITAYEVALLLRFYKCDAEEIETIPPEAKRHLKKMLVKDYFGEIVKEEIACKPD